MNLFKLSNELIDKLDEFENSQDLDLITELEITKDSLDKKVISYDFVINDLKGKEETISSQIKRLQAFKKQLQTRQNTLKRALLQVLLLFGEDRKLTKTQEQKGLSRAGKKLEIITDEGRVLLSETIRQKPIYDPLSLEPSDIEYTIKLRGDALKKLNSNDYEVVKQEQKPSEDKVYRYEEVSSLRIS